MMLGIIRHGLRFSLQGIAALWLLGVALTLAQPVSASATDLPGAGPLRAAIEDLAASFATDYLNGRQYLERLDRLEERAAAGQEVQDELNTLRRESLLDNPLLTDSPLMFVVRRQYARDHHNTGTMFQPGEINASSFQGGGAIRTIDFARGGKVTTLVEFSDGVARDLEVSFDGQKILFAMRADGARPYHIHEMNVDGTGLVPLTFGSQASDVDPAYLPDGRIVFASTRDPKYCGCNRHIQANLFVMDADGANVHQIGRNNLFESRPSMTADGRILYDRWEYVDRHFGPSFGLWTVRPDGTHHGLFYGNNAWSPGAIFDARVVPGSQQFLAVFGACHDRPWGAMVLVDRRYGLDGMEPVVQSWPADIRALMPDPQEVPRKAGTEHPHAGLIDRLVQLPVKYEDPWPLSDKYFLCSRMTGEGEQMGVFLLDVFGNEILLHTEQPGCFDPMPLAARPRPPIVPGQMELSEPTATFYVADVYRGTGMKRVPRGTIKTIRVVEAPPKRNWTRPGHHWHIDTHQAPAMNFNCTNNKRILGDAPVEADGSAYFEAPPDRFVFFQLLDDNGMMVQSMRSGTTAQPGEQVGCVGCHENRLSSVPLNVGRMAMRRPASKLRPWYGPEREFNYLSEVQPVFDKHCVQCHDYGKEGGKMLNLAGDLGLVFNASYLDLRTKSPIRWHADIPGEPKALVKAVDDGPPQVLPPYAWGSHRSRLADILLGEHHDVQLDRESLDRVITWIDLNAPYYGTYASAYPNNRFGRSPLDDHQLARLAAITGVPVNAINVGAELLGSQVNFTRPQWSLCLAKLDKAGPEYREALAIIRAGQDTLAKVPRADMPFSLRSTDERSHPFPYLSLLCVAATGNRAPADVLAQEPPPSPPQNEWTFVDALAAPVTWNPHWSRDEKKSGEAGLNAGVVVEAAFPDPDGLLDTAYRDLHVFFKSVGIPPDGPYRISTEQVPTGQFETFRLVVSESECRIQANDTEGIRRGIFFLEDELTGADGPFLSLGETERSPFIHTRISRCFFGPIKRPPKNKDELLDDVDYYPGDYLNRLAHDGVNGLWLTIEFKDICKTSLTPICDPNRERRLEKLRKTVAKCRRYGIEVFIFCIEPRVMSPDNPLLKEHPEIGSKPFRGSSFLFCPFPDASQTYLYEAVNDVFTEVPNLGGLINISFGERSTTCLSGADENWQVACPTCAEKQPGEILNASLSAMERGMHAANPDAKLISWLYVPGNGTGVQRSVEPLIDIARHTPPGVICQYNFESDGTKVQLGRERHAGDYWLSYVGPSAAFENIAAGAAEGGVEMGAKLQACNSFEVSTVPYVPVPSNLYRKYREMRRLGVTSVMQCWYIGNMPSVMNRAAASVLPFAPEGLTEDEFLQKLARRDWGPAHADDVVRAWRLFAEAYDNYPLTNAFQYYGPMHDGIVWPLHLKPVHRNLSPVWKLEFPPSGDRIGECFSGSHSLEEVLELCKRMSDTWQEGLDCLLEFKPLFADDPARRQDITVAEALGIQFRSGYNTLRFYALREELLYGLAESRAETLGHLRELVDEEIENSEKMAALCDINPFLGFQAEAEGYTYFPAELHWRVERLRDVLRTEFEEAEAAIATGKDVFPGESGLTEGPFNHRAVRVSESFASNWQNEEAWKSLPRALGDSEDPGWSWQAAHDGTSLYLNVECASSEQWRAVEVTIPIEPTHVYPRRTFRANVHGKRAIRQGWLAPDAPWEFAAPKIDGRQAFRLRIPFDGFQGEADLSRPMRLNIEMTLLSHDKKTQVVRSWAPPSEHPVKARLGYGGDNPSEMGWLRLE